MPVTSANRIKVTFNASISDTLPWKFIPQQREVRVLPGETALAFYKATNLGDKDIIGVATYSVTPAQCAPYFSKIQCFCFEEQRLNAGETVDMPVFFYLDPDLLTDLNMKGIETVTLNYTFFSKLIGALGMRLDMLTSLQKQDTTITGGSSLRPVDERIVEDVRYAPTMYHFYVLYTNRRLQRPSYVGRSAEYMYISSYISILFCICRDYAESLCLEP